MKNEQDDMMTRGQVADLMQVSEMTVHRLEKLGLPVTAVGPKIVRYRRADVMEFLTSRTTTSESN